MSAVYKLRSHKLDNFIVTKFDDDFNIESYYEMTVSDGVVRCGCPAGAREICRHRQMFPDLLTRLDTAWFLDFDTRQWVDPTGEASEAIGIVSYVELPETSTPTEVAEAFSKLATPQRTTIEGNPTSESQRESFLRSSGLPPRDDHPFRRRM